MRVVLDTNVLASALIRPGGWTARVLGRTELELFVPEVVAEEMESHEAEFAERATCSREEWRSRVRAALAQIRAVRTGDAIAFSDHPIVAKARIVDPDDAFLIASYLAAQAQYLWTRDRALLRAFPAFAVRELPQED